MTLQEALTHLDSRARFACDKLGNGSRIQWQAEDCYAVQVILRHHALLAGRSPAGELVGELLEALA